MKYCLGLITLLALSTQALAASSSLILRGHIQPTFKVDLSSGTPRILSNVKGEFSKPILKVEKQSSGYMITVIQP